MESVLQRERSLKKLHHCIANYSLTYQEKASLLQAQQDLRDKIEFKFRRSAINQNYVFPRKQTVSEQYGEETEFVDLHRQPEPDLDVEVLECKQKPKIKLAKGRNDKRMQTQHVQKTQNEEKTRRTKADAIYVDISYRPLRDNNPNFVTAPTQPMKQRVKTEYVDQDEQNRYTKSIRKNEEHHATGTLHRQNIGSKSKSKLNMLTKSYMNLKSNKLAFDNSLQKLAPNSIRINDYKFMPGSSHNKTYNNHQNGHNSTRQLRDLLNSNQINSAKPNREIVKDSIDQKNLQKIGSLLPDKRYFKVR